MSSLRPFFPLLVVAALLPAGPAGATTVRAFVASYGIDANAPGNCTLANPCRTLAAASTVVSAGGEIVILDTAGYGPVTITQALTIEAPAGVYGGVAVAAGSDGIVVNAPGQIVRLVGLTIVGAAGANNGVNVLNAHSVVLRDCTIASMTNGISVTAGDVFLEQSNVTLSTNNDLQLLPTTFSATGTSASAYVLDSVLGRNGNDGIYATDGTAVAVRNSVITGSTSHSIQMTTASSHLSLLSVDTSLLTGSVTGAHILLQSGGVAADLISARIRQSTTQYGATGLELVGGAGSTFAYLDDDTFENHTTGISNAGTVLSYQNNRITATTAISGTALGTATSY